MNEPTESEHRVRSYESGWTVEAVLLKSLFLPAREIRRLAAARAIRVNRGVAAPSDTVATGDLIRVGRPLEEGAGIEPAAMEIRIVHEDQDLIVLDKPPYLLVHPTSPDQRHTLVNGLAHHYLTAGVRAGIHPVHRLDQNTSGLVLIGKTPDAHRILGAQIATREMSREYLACAWGTVPADAGTIDAPIGRHPTQPVLRAVRHEGDPAVTRYTVVERFPAATLVALRLETGRTHQIRVHMAHVGHPLLGDRQYGRRGLKLIRRQALHAFRLAFRHPRSGQTVAVEAPLPEDMVELIDRLRTPAPEL
jgi:23S rRNA pseudouridine1911/1915/1917 synthase